MEHNPSGNNSPETPSTESDTTDTKNGKSKKSSKSIGHSVFSAPESVSSALFDTVKKDEKQAQPTLFPETKADNNPTNNIEKNEATEPQLEELAHDEVQQVVQETAEHDLAEITQADPTTAAELAAAVPFLEEVSQGADVDEVFAREAAKLDMSEADIEAVLNGAETSSEADADKEPTAGAETGAETPTNIDEDEGEIDLHSGGSSTGAAAGAGASGSGGSGSAGRGRGSSGGSGIPPLPGPGGMPAAVPGGAPPRPVGPPVGPNTFTQTANVNALPPAAANYYQNPNRAKAGQLLVVGIVGYLIGRRRGRIRTEKKLLPVQRRLEKQVTNLQEDLRYKERALVAAKARQNRPVATETQPNQVAAAPPRQETKQFMAKERTQPGLQETRLGLQKPRAERLGHLVVTAESPAAARTVVERPNNIRQAYRAEEVKDMRRNDLLELSEKIIVEGASLRRIYETHLIGEKQLRHLVSEYLQGKDIRKDLRKEMVEHEIDFERDPILRDRVRSHLAGDGGSKGGLDELLASVGITNDADDAKAAKKQAEYQQQQTDRQRKQQQKRVVADSAMATAIVVLAVVVLALLLRG